jgi:hypothetical protein
MTLKLSTQLSSFDIENYERNLSSNTENHQQKLSHLDIENH